MTPESTGRHYGGRRGTADAVGMTLSVEITLGWFKTMLGYANEFGLPLESLGDHLPHRAFDFLTWNVAPVRLR